MRLTDLLASVLSRTDHATVFSYRVQDPECYDVVGLAEDGRLEPQGKDAKLKSHHAMTGLYFYDNRAVDDARNVEPSARGELEITDFKRLYIEAGELYIEQMVRCASCRYTCPYLIGRSAVGYGCDQISVMRGKGREASRKVDQEWINV